MQREVILIFGKTGSGKSTLAKKILPQFERSIILDPLHEYDGTIFVEFLPFASHVQSLFDGWNERTFTVVLRPSEDNDVYSFFKLCRYLPNYLLCVEETDFYLNPREQSEEDFRSIINYGRHQNISILGIARRVPELSTQLRSQATHIYTFRQTEPHDLEMLELYGFNAVEIPSLPDHEYRLITSGNDKRDLSIDSTGGSKPASSFLFIPDGGNT